MPRLVRRAPLSERIKAYLDPYDLLLRISEELNDDAHDEWLNEWATSIGLGLNLLFILARGASRPTSASARDEVFGDPEGKNGSGWFAWLAAILVQLLTLLCCANALYTFLRKRYYRLFERSVDIAPATPSAHRVRVDSSPISASPLHFVKNVIARTTASSRAHPDPERDVWELRVWDPKEFNLKIFTLFSPGHALLYFSMLPPATLEPRPLATVLTAIAFGALLSFHLVLLRTSFSQQSKDTALVHGEVMHEYNTKFVHPSLNHPVRDVGVQTQDRSNASTRGARIREVDVYTPTTILKRGFTVNPNSNYAALYDPDRLSATTSNNPITHAEEPRRRSASSRTTTTTSAFADPTFATPHSGYANAQTQSALAPPSSVGGPDFSSPLKQLHERLERPDARRGGAGGDGGSMGVYTHAASPLRKKVSERTARSSTSTGLTGSSGSNSGGTSALARGYGARDRDVGPAPDSNRRRENPGRYF